MFEEYEDCVVSVGEADCVIKNAVDELENLLTSEARSLMEQARSAKKESEGANMELLRLKRAISEADAELERKKRKLDEYEKTCLPNEFVRRMVFNATGGYAPGDKVYQIVSDRHESKCTACGGSKEISVTIDGTEHKAQCPVCKGWGYVATYTDRIKESTVSSVYLKLCFRKDRVSYWNTECVFLDGKDSSTNPKKIFRTKEDAERAIAEKEDTT